MSGCWRSFQSLVGSSSSSESGSVSMKAEEMLRYEVIDSVQDMPKGLCEAQSVEGKLQQDGEKLHSSQAGAADRPLDIQTFMFTANGWANRVWLTRASL
jgi:hypothetical protein